MGFMPDVKGITAKLDERFQQMMQILQEMLQVLREIRDQRGPQ